MKNPKLISLSALSISSPASTHRVARLQDLLSPSDPSVLQIVKTIPKCTKPALRLIINHHPEVARRSRFAQMMSQYCDSLDRQIEEIMRL